MLPEEDLKTFYKTKYIYPAPETNKHDAEDDKPNKIIGTTSLPFLKKISINSNHTLYSSPSNSLNVLNTNQNIFKHINLSINQRLIDVYKNKIKVSVKWRKAYDTIRNKMKISPSRRQSTDERQFKMSFKEKSKECNHIIQLLQINH